MAIQATYDKIWDDVLALRDQGVWTDVTVGQGLIAVAQGEFLPWLDEEHDALVRLAWAFHIREVAVDPAALPVAAMELDLLTKGARTLEETRDDMGASAKCHPARIDISQSLLPASWVHSANAVSEVLDWAGHDLRLLVEKPLADWRGAKVRMDGLEEKASATAHSLLAGEESTSPEAATGSTQERFFEQALTSAMAGLQAAISAGVPPTESDMGRILTGAHKFFNDDDWNFERIPGNTTLRMGFSGTDGQWTCFAQAREESEQFVFYSRLPANVADEHRTAMAEFITRANHGMVIGNFEMDYSDGEVRYKTSIDVEGTALNHELIKPIVYANVTMMSTYFKALLAVAYGAVTPAAAIQMAE